MLTADQAKDKLYRKAEEFKKYFYEKKWSQAKHAYDSASTVAVFLELEERDMMQLFGSRAYVPDDEEPRDGLFREEMVERAYWECIRRNQTYEVKPYSGNPNTTPHPEEDVWSRQQNVGAAHSPYEVYRGSA